MSDANSYGLLEAANRLSSVPASPYSLNIEFVWPIPERDWTELLPGYDARRAGELAAQHVRSLAAPLADTVRKSLLDDETVDLVPTSIGRGADAEAVALVIYTGINVLANLDGLISFFMRVKAWYRDLRGSALASGSPVPGPMLSLGAAVALVGADLADRVSTTSGIRVLSAAVHPKPELMHSGADLYSIVFGSDQATWVYLVDSSGRILSRSQGRPLPAWGRFYYGAGASQETDYEQLGDSDDEHGRPNA